MSKSRGRILVELATANKSQYSNYSSVQNNIERTLPKKTLPKPWLGQNNDTGEIWKQSDYEHDSFFNLVDKESINRLNEWFFSDSSASSTNVVSAAPSSNRIESAHCKIEETYLKLPQPSQQLDTSQINDANDATIVGTGTNDPQLLEPVIENIDDANDITDTEISGPLEDYLKLIQNLEDSDDPDYHYNSSDLDSDDMPQKEIQRKEKKKEKGKKKRKNFSVSQNNYDSHLDDNQPPEALDLNANVPKRMVKHSSQKNKNTRKRSIQVPSWLKSQAKENRNTGQAYWSTSSKSYVPGKALKDGCGENCKFKCRQKLSDAQRQAIFSRFWKIGNLQGQREFVRGSITDINTSTLHRKRSANQAFYMIQDNNSKVRVCKKFFIGTLGISHRWISTIKKKTFDGILQPDLRGHHDKHKKVDLDIVNDIRAHIESIPRIDSHYLRSQTSRQYIAGNKSIASIYRDYVENSKVNNRPFGTEDKFRRVFETEFNISFYIPKKDQCDLCAAYNNLLPQEQENMKEEYELHLANKNIARDQKEYDKTKTDPDVIVCTYDLQKSLETPSGDVSQFYYKSKLSTYNLTIYELKTKMGYCNIWHEAEGKRGSIEIGTCVFKYIETKIKETPGDEPLNFIFYSDNCSGQQKNKYLIGMYMCATLKYIRINSITHKFLVTGHTQNEGDNMHAVIEKEIARARKRGPIYVPSQYVQLIRTSKKNPPYYQIKEFTHKEFIDLKSLQNQIGENFNINTEGQKVKFSKIVEAKITREKPLTLLYKLSFEDNYKEIETAENENLRRRSQRKNKNSEHGTMSTERINTIKEWNKPAYNKPCGIPENTHKDLMSLINNNLIPATYKDFYSSLTLRNSNLK